MTVAIRAASFRVTPELESAFIFARTLSDLLLAQHLLQTTSGVRGMEPHISNLPRRDVSVVLVCKSALAEFAQSLNRRPFDSAYFTASTGIGLERTIFSATLPVRK
jgi:hypothetical protein